MSDNINPISKYISQKKYYDEHMKIEEWRQHRREICLINVRKMRAKKRAELIASGNIPKLGRIKGGKNKPKNINDKSPSSEPPELFNIVL